MAVVWCNPANVGSEDGLTRATGWVLMSDALSDPNLDSNDGVRVADSGNHTVLSGTLAWVNGSASVNTSVDLTSSLSSGDIIAKSDFESNDDETPHEVVSITSSVITLKEVYVGTDETISGNILLSTFDDINWVIDQSVPVSCGWKSIDTTEATGFTYLRKTGASTGTGILISNHFVTLDRCGCFRYDRNLHVFNFWNAIVTNFYSVSAADEAIYLQFAHGIHLENVWSTGSDDNGFSFEVTYGSKMKNIYAHSNDEGVFFNSCGSIITDISTKYNRAGIDIRGGGVQINGCVIENNTDGFNFQSALNVNINNPSFSNNTNDLTFFSSRELDSEDSTVSIQNYDLISYDNRLYFSTFGVISRNTVEARGSECRDFDVNDADFYITEKNKFFPVVQSTQATITYYVKDNASFNGDLEASLWFEGKIITDWTNVPLTNSYVQQSIIAQSSDIDKNGHVELKLRARGTSGNVYLADDNSDYGVS